MKCDFTTENNFLLKCVHFGSKSYHCVLLKKKPKYNLQNGLEVNNDQKESFFITERNLESIDPNEDVTVRLKSEKKCNLIAEINVLDLFFERSSSF